LQLRFSGGSQAEKMCASDVILIGENIENSRGPVSERTGLVEDHGVDFSKAIEVPPVGEPYAGNPHARFDELGRLRSRSWKAFGNRQSRFGTCGYTLRASSS
jgi:hypothetical protein